jgi:hypothetical protein
MSDVCTSYTLTERVATSVDVPASICPLPLYHQQQQAQAQCHSSISSHRVTMKPLSPSTLPPRPSGFAVFVSPLTVLPGSTEPEPATIVINQETGKVVDVIPGQLIRDETSLDTRKYGDLKVDKFVEIPEGRVLLPGLVE